MPKEARPASRPAPTIIAHVRPEGLDAMVDPGDGPVSCPGPAGCDVSPTSARDVADRSSGSDMSPHPFPNGFRGSPGCGLIIGDLRDGRQTRTPPRHGTPAPPLLHERPGPPPMNLIERPGDLQSKAPVVHGCSDARVDRLLVVADILTRA